MARVLIVGEEPVLAAAIEDRLRAAGHHVELADDADRALGEGRARQASLLLLALPPLAGAAIEAIRALRAEPDTADLPVLVSAERADSADRLALLRAGADDFLAKPYDLEEMALKVERLLGTRQGGLRALEGDLAAHPPWELLQYIDQLGRAGSLTVRGPTGTGRFIFARGGVTAARWGALAGEEAMLALLGAEGGHFRFTAEEEGGDGASPPAAEAALPLRRVLFFASWLEDELERRRHLLPTSGTPLRATGDAPPPAEGELERLPIERVLATVRERPQTRLYDLLGEVAAAPVKVRLAVAWLIEQGALAAAPRADAYPSTGEIDISVLFALAVDELVTSAHAGGFTGSTVPYLLLVEPGAWGALEALFERVPSAGSSDAFHELGAQLKRRRGGTALLAGREGRLALHVQELTDGMRLQIGSVVPVCAGMLVWLDRGAAAEAIRGAIDRLEAMEGEPIGMLVAPGEEAQAAADRLTLGTRRWSVSPHPPGSLLTVLRLLRRR